MTILYMLIQEALDDPTTLAPVRDELREHIPRLQGLAPQDANSL